MSGETRDMSESELLAYVDGELDAAARARVERRLESDPVAAALVEEWRMQNRRLEALYSSAAREPVPDRLRPDLMTRPRRDRAAGSWRQMAAALMLLTLGAGSGWFGHALLAPEGAAGEPLVAQAIEAHDLYSREVLHPVEVKAEDSAHLQTWLSKRLDRKLSIPDLQPLGLSLIGGRLLPGAGGEPAAQIMYEDTGGQRLTLYVLPTEESGESAFRYAKLDGLEAISWRDENVRCVLVGGLPRERLQTIAKLAYGELI
ncbi:hypothetical protein NS226_18950 [Aureimonas ureilytica]|uniref:Anti-sigma factor n=1 Tax=Aureimonas ureilytica TaxID=401562 RepID=A0A175R635_9HYPH|nr:anti-sigma factor [Aureimonas ureilytica]KTQ85801.1 hypothetical protein NS226_18950 [Aureimonas ureilytica]